MINKGSLNHEKLEKQEFDALLTETANAFRKVLIIKTNMLILFIVSNKKNSYNHIIFNSRRINTY